MLWKIKNIALLEDHDQALAVWKKLGLRDKTLVHIDAHLDFALPAAERPLAALAGAASIRELKAGLEKSLAFLKYEKDYSKQTDIGNYIYPAVESAIVREIFWVIPGPADAIRTNRRLLERMLWNLLRIKPAPETSSQALRCEFRGIPLTICTLNALPSLDGALLDIDADFLVVADLRQADNTCEIGRRRLRCTVKKLLGALAGKISRPACVTIAHSTNGGYTPMKFRTIGTELAQALAPERFKTRLRRSLRAAACYAEFLEKRDKRSYRMAVRLDPAYGGPYNSLGELYLEKAKLGKAAREFALILAADPDNPFALAGLARVKLRRRRWQAAAALLEKALRNLKARGFKRQKADILSGLAEARLRLKHFSPALDAAGKLLACDPLSAHARFLAAEAARKLGLLKKASTLYQNALQLGFPAKTARRGLRACAGREYGAIISVSRRKLPG